MRSFALRALFAVVAFASVASPGAAAAGSFDLVGRGEGGYGQHGLYLGPSDWRGPDNIYFNWEFTDVSAEIGADGDMWIGGSMERLYDRWQYGAGALSWDIEIHLHDVVRVGDAFTGFTGSYAEALELLTSLPGGAASLEWRELSMELVAPYHSAVEQTGWIGFAMPAMGHDNVAELTYVDGAWHFDAWYQNPSAVSQWYTVGDTKAQSPGNGIVPEPGAASVFLAGLLLVARSLRA